MSTVFQWLVSFNPHHPCAKYFPHTFQVKKQGSERLTDQPEITQLIRSLFCQTQKSVHYAILLPKTGRSLFSHGYYRYLSTLGVLLVFLNTLGMQPCGVDLSFRMPLQCLQGLGSCVCNFSSMLIPADRLPYGRNACAHWIFKTNQNRHSPWAFRLIEGTDNEQLNKWTYSQKLWLVPKSRGMVVSPRKYNWRT